MAKVFISYSHNDTDLRDKLEQHLSLLKRNQVIEVWHDRRIEPGQEFEKEIDLHVETDDIIILLVSSAFIDSDYCHNREMMRAMERHNAGEAIVIPVILRPCYWRGAKFGKLLATPTDGRAVTSYSNPDEALVEVAHAVLKAAERVARAKSEGLTKIPPESPRESGEARPADQPTPIPVRRSTRWLWSFPAVALSPNRYSIPDVELDDITQITEELLRTRKIEALILDIDQTLVPQNESDLAEETVAHIKHLAMVLRGKVCFLTNEPGETREQKFRASTGLPVVSGNWKKPEPDAFNNALKCLDIDQPNRVAMVGDRRWTDVLGAKRAGLQAILVNAISPSRDTAGVRLARSAEIESSKAGKKTYFAFVAAMAVLAVVNFATALWFIAGVFEGSPTKYLGYLSGSYRYAWIALFVVFGVLYFRLVWSARARVIAQTTEPIAGYFNTFPLALRSIVSALLLIVILFSPAGDQFVQVGLTFCLFTCLTLGFSLFPLYHQQGMRIFRIVADVFLVAIMTNGLHGYFKFLALAYLCVPIATAARHFGTLSTFVVGIASVFVLAYFSFITFPMLDQAANVLGLIVLIMYLMTGLTLRLEYFDLSRPYVEFVRSYEDGEQGDRLRRYLSGAARSINCAGVLVVKLSEGGAFYFGENQVRFGKIGKSAAGDIARFISQHHDQLNQLDLSRSSHISLHCEIMKGIEAILNPPIRSGITAAIAVRVPQGADVYFIAINPFSRNGTSRSQFWVTHVAVIKVLALGIGISLSPFLRDKDMKF